MLNLTDLRGRTVNIASALPRADQDITATLETVTPILEQVRTGGEQALLDLSERFDGVRPDSLRVPRDVMQQALEQLDPTVRQALETLIGRAREVHAAQLPASTTVSPGPDAQITNRWVPVDRVGLYVPGGQAVYPSSVVMNVIPAQVAGVASLAIASPPQKDFGGWPHPTVLAAAELLGVEEVYAVGGAQAVGMFAYGARAENDDVVAPPVSLITGPGNIYVATAKRAVQGTVGIDSEAGPTEIMVLADGSAPADLIAADLISQAEHDELAAAVLVTDSEELAREVQTQVQAQAETTKHLDRVKQSLSGAQSAVLLVGTMDEAVEVANAYGAEHLEIMTAGQEELAGRISNAGAVFLGPYTPVSLGDYCAGSNHVLPTGGSARYSSGLNVTSFLRSQQVIHYGRQGLGEVARQVEALALAEDLPAHGEAISVRFR
ncbi:histidinol dehydrogenase [Nesterenkonia sp. MY13]|uniref:Histidinol dehydrogenase n=1 Tax=Nesterenkonia sedimenti TaxID=1463632 RepID=A0A7X8TIZ6_9MICC|nr:histidinol dehydrogenase [Nesterenkonia sedimenti]NLS09345.1 histidinol dehydrogenase [Nesterenkonia sedimenti]